MEIILDVGSGNSNPDIKTAKKIIDSIANVDKKRVCILKYQIWAEDNPQGKNKRLTHEIFEFAYKHATQKGFKVTASVFDLKSLDYILNREKLSNGDKRLYSYNFCVPFIKIANRRDLYWLIEKTPRTMPVYVSYDSLGYLPPLSEIDKRFACISKYPALSGDYFYSFEKRGCNNDWMPDYISDHTVGLDFMKTMMLHGVKSWEKHFKLDDSTGPDAGAFAITPKELKEIL